MSDEWEIAALLSRYGDLVDSGDFIGLGELFADGAIRFSEIDEVVTGAEAVRSMYEGVVLLHEGSPRTKHVMSNYAIVVESDSSRATARSYYTVFQALPGRAIQAIAAGRYEDRFENFAGRWRFVDRLIVLDLVGDLSSHLRAGTTG